MVPQKQSVNNFHRKNATKIILLLAGVGIGIVGLLFFQNFVKQKETDKITFSNPSPTIVADSTPTITPSEAPTRQPTKPVTSKPTPTPQPVVNGATVDKIKYTLPDGWEAKVDSSNLFIAPGNGGYLSITVYDYPGVTGRREFYCQIRDVCISGNTEFSTKFEPTIIGNISGYIPGPIDNSGGGTEYFGAKGNKFYVISTYTPPMSDVWKKIEQIISSLVF